MENRSRKPRSTQAGSRSLPGSARRRRDAKETDVWHPDSPGMVSMNWRSTPDSAGLVSKKLTLGTTDSRNGVKETDTRLQEWCQRNWHLSPDSASMVSEKLISDTNGVKYWFSDTKFSRNDVYTNWLLTLIVLNKRMSDTNFSSYGVKKPYIWHQWFLKKPTSDTRHSRNGVKETDVWHQTLQECVKETDVCHQTQQEWC